MPIKFILKNINFPLAMPSANISSHVSPVSAKDVSDEFNKKIEFIILAITSIISIDVDPRYGTPRVAQRRQRRRDRHLRRWSGDEAGRGRTRVRLPFASGSSDRHDGGPHR